MCNRASLLADATRWEKDLKQDQQENADIGPVVVILEEGSERLQWEPATKFLCLQWSVLKLNEGVLNRQRETSDGQVKFWQTVVPRQKRAELLRKARGGNVSGHFGVKETLARLQQRVYWAGMRDDMKEWCKACDVCRAKIGPSRRVRPPLHFY